MRSRIDGFIRGGLIGDSYPAPLEFAGRDRIQREAPELDRFSMHAPLGPGDWDRLEEGFQLRAFGAIRPRNESFGAWQIMAPAGAVTDDTRQKILALAALRRSRMEGRPIPTGLDLAEASLQTAAEWSARFGEEIVEDGLGPMLRPARWILGSRCLQTALPPELVLDGRATCLGLLTTPILAPLFAEDPSAAYFWSLENDWTANGEAADINASVLAALASALADDAPDLCSFTGHLASFDPFRLKETRWVSRRLLVHLWAADEAVRRAEGSPARFMEVLDEISEAETGWEARVTLMHALAMLKFAGSRPVGALMLCAAYGRDSDSTGQLIGQIAGALLGRDAWPEAAWQAVRANVQEVYGEDPDAWTSELCSS